MKYLAVFLFVSVSTADRLENTYLPPISAKSAGGAGSFLKTPVAVAPLVRTHAGPTAAPIAILRLNNDNNGDGTYRFDFETENHISQQEVGQIRNAPEGEAVASQGSYSYAGPDGQIYTINYVADENGFQPQGDHIPTAPPVPAEILKALEQNAADEAAGIVDDGQYRPDAPGWVGRQAVASGPNVVKTTGGYRY